MIHVIPIGADTDRKHVQSLECWCHPEVVEGATQPTCIHHKEAPSDTPPEPKPENPS